MGKASRQERQRRIRRPIWTSAQAQGELPPKQPGVHRWIAICSYAVTEQQAGAAHSGSFVTLDRHNCFTVMMGCWDCEQEYGPAHGKPCPAEAIDVDPSPLSP